MTRNNALSFIPLAGLLTLIPFGAAHATSSTVVYPVEGSPSCKMFSENSVQSLASMDVAPGVEKTVNGYIKYKITADGRGLASWEVVSTGPGRTPVNFVIVTATKGGYGGGLKSEVYHFGTQGALSDTDATGPGSLLKKVTFCYGLSGPSHPPSSAQLPSCDDLDGDGTLDESGITCPASGGYNTGDERIIISVDPNAPNGGIQACTCNFNTPLTSCDTSLPAGAPGSCLPNPNTAGVGLDWVPAEIVIWQNGTGFCYTTLSGNRACVYR